ncbi:MAG: hypothetical protein JNL90_12380 [Planctomycetes bacterium]|nr:hypothetical protein [Planctomycetota bacterium]
MFCVAACRGSATPTGEPTSSEPPIEGPSPAGAVSAASAAAALELRTLLAGMGVTLLEQQRRLEVAGFVNQQAGAVELFACAPEGKTHESIVVLDCVPSGLHAGLLALGLVPGRPAGMEVDGQWRPPTGPPVEVRVRWSTADGAAHEARAEEWILDQQRGAVMEPVGWLFVGSYSQEGSGGASNYAADQVKSLITTYHDASTILENPLKGGRDDALYEADARVVPPVGTRIVVSFTPGS